jgi:hypothetical protein
MIGDTMKRHLILKIRIFQYFIDVIEGFLFSSTVFLPRTAPEAFSLREGKLLAKQYLKWATAA